MVSRIELMSFRTILVQCDADKKLPPDWPSPPDWRSGLCHLVGPCAAPSSLGASMVALPSTWAISRFTKTRRRPMRLPRQPYRGDEGQGDPKEWRVVTAPGGRTHRAVLHRRSVVVGQTDPDAATSTPSGLPQHVALASGRPVLVVPHTGVQGAPGKTVMLCWNASRESARAATEALPLLQAAGKVTVLIVDEEAAASGESADRGADIGRPAARAQPYSASSTARMSATIPSRAADLGADLIAAGIYGHSYRAKWSWAAPRNAACPHDPCSWA
jgi:hypothetical protein